MKKYKGFERKKQMNYKNNEHNGQKKGRGLDCLPVLALSFLAGITNGLLGAGGGIILIFMLSRYLAKTGANEKYAFALSCIAVFCFSGVSAAVYAARGNLSFEAASPYLIPALVGGIAGALILRRVSPVFLKKMFALLLVYGGVRMLL